MKGSDDAAGAHDAASDRRVATRTPAADLPRALTCRITPGRDVRVVDISAAGMLVESTSPLFPGRTVKLHLHADARRLMVSGTVVRGYMSAADRERGATFASAIAFERHVDLEKELAE
jgi:hypothetical protein